MECLDKREKACRYCMVCRQISVWHEAQRILANYLSGISVEQISDKFGLREDLVQWEQTGQRETIGLALSSAPVQESIG